MRNRHHGQACFGGDRSRDPLKQKVKEANDMDMLRLCDMHNIPVATNIATAEVLIHGLERGDLDWRNIIK